jgi:hypothetical protein
MEKPIYGIASKVSTTQDCPTQTLTPTQLTGYINRSTGYVSSLLNDSTRNKQHTINLLSVVRQELCYLTGKEFVGLTQSSTSGVTTGPGGKQTISTTLISQTQT